MELDDVRAFVTVATCGSISQAARDLNITQSAVTRRLQRLEMSLGATLFDRRTRPVTVTAAGEAALGSCRRLINDVREVRAAIGNGHAAIAEIRVGVAHALTELTLIRPVGQLRRKFPGVALRICTGWSRELLERVRTGALDAGVVLLPEGERLPAEVVGREIGKEQLVVVAQRTRRPHAARSLQDLTGAQWILNPEGCAARASLRRVLTRANVDMIVGVETYNYELQLALVAQGRGLSLVPRAILSRSRMKSRLRVLRVPGIHFPLTVSLLRQERFAAGEQVLAELSRLLIESFRAK
jgi:DNA-binding transcriptional LysR family regulator